MRSVLTESPTYETYNPITDYPIRDRLPRIRASSSDLAEGADHFESRRECAGYGRQPGYNNNDLRGTTRGRDETNDGNGEAEREPQDPRRYRR
jgi:hypothetical protein